MSGWQGGLEDRWIAFPVGILDRREIGAGLFDLRELECGHPILVGPSSWRSAILDLGGLGTSLAGRSGGGLRHGGGADLQAADAGSAEGSCRR
jgi:hypothetical protein